MSCSVLSSWQGGNGHVALWASCWLVELACWLLCGILLIGALPLSHGQETAGLLLAATGTDSWI